MLARETDSAAEVSWRHSWLFRWVIPGLLSISAIWIIWYFVIRDGRPGVAAALGSVISAALCMSYARYLDRAKRVWLDADQIVISDYRQTIKLPRTGIVTATQNRWLWPTRICVEFDTPNAFGTRIVFFPPPAATTAEVLRLVTELRAPRTGC